MLNYTQLYNNIYIVKEDSTRTNILNSLLLEEEKESCTILIDTNYPFRAIDLLYSRLNYPVKALILSHFHTDHTAHVFFHEQKFKTPIYCPVREGALLKSINDIMDSIGFSKLSLRDTYLMFAKKHMKFQECKQVNTYTPGNEIFNYSNIDIKTIHIPGHSPGHTAFIIESNKNIEDRKILYASDIGALPYCGDLNNNLKQYRESITKLEKIYLSDDFILIPSHGNFYIEKDDSFFKRIRGRIKKIETKILNSLSKTKPKSIKNLVDERILTPEKEIYPPIKDLYYLWDGGMILQHLNEFIEKQIIEKIEEKDLLNDKYILV
ncbi:MAG: MBL fold metallo-hydrolase [Promethearchaeota archaeon]